MKKKFLIAVLVVIAIGMGVGYSILSQQLKIEGNATLDAQYNVEITSFERQQFYNKEEKFYGSGGQSSSTEEIEAPTITGATVNFDVKIAPGDQLVYKATIRNTGNIPSIINGVNLSKTGSEGIEIVDADDINLTNLVLQPGEEVHYFIRLAGNANVELDAEELVSNITLTFDTQQYINTAGTQQEELKPYIVFGTTGIQDEGRYGCEILVYNYSMDGNVPAKLYAKVNDGDYELIEELDKITLKSDNFMYYYPEYGNVNDIIKLKVEVDDQQSNEIILKAVN